MPLPLTRTLLVLLSLLTLFFLFTYVSLTSLTAPSSSTHNRQSATNFLFPSTAVISLSDDNSTCFISRPAAFGPSLPKSGLKGELFVLEEGQLACDDTPGWDPSAASPPSLANQGDGTDDMDYASSGANKEESKSQHADIESLQQSAEIGGKIVLVTRGGCGFLEKVLWAQRRGAVALIVGDYKRVGSGLGSGGLVTMYAKGDTSNVTIPSIFTTHTTARLLTSLLPKYLTSSVSHHSLPAVEALAPAPPAAKEEGGSRIKWLFSGNADSEPHESGMAVLIPTTTSAKAVVTTSTSISTSTPTPTMIAGSLPEWKGVQVDSSHRPPMSGELEGIVFVVKSEEMKKDDEAIDGEGEREGLWITLTPASMSTSPIFDTLLVLVVSPLVTLTVVYALLLVRSMIRRRRWRAPKSVVDRLPVRTYQSTSTATTPAIAYPSSSTPSPPPQKAPSPPPQHPPRSSSLPTSSTASPSRTIEKKDSVEGSREEVPRRSRYMGGSVECVVCLEEYVDGVSRVMKLPCGHEFHASCITPWLTTRRRTCPICKGDVVRGTAAGSSGSGWTRHSDAGEVSERTPLVGDEEERED